MSAGTPVVLERDNVNDESVTLVRWIAHHGDKVDVNTPIAEIETSKANVEVYAPSAGYLHCRFQQGDEIPITEPIAHISSEPAAPEEMQAGQGPETPALPELEPSKTMAAQADGLTHSGKGEVTFRARSGGPELEKKTEYRQRFSPIAAKVMAMNGLTAEDFRGLSVVRKQDVLDRLNPPAPPVQTSPHPAASRGSASLPTQPYKTVPISKSKRREASNLTAGVDNALQSSVAVTCFTRGLRRAIERKTNGGSASALIVYEVSRLLRKYPVLNATYRDGACLQYEGVHVGYAMDDGRGLKVPVIHDCDKLSLQEITQQFRMLAEGYVQDKLTPAQLSNPTFTISDLSGLAVSHFFPLISENQGAILGVSGEQFTPDGAHGWYSLILTFDHQLADGRTASLFLNDLKERLGQYEDSETRSELACSKCLRTLAELRSNNHFLLSSAVPNETVCTICLMGA